jgi:hypothetical protein
MPRFFARWWARESPGNRVIETAGRLAQLDARTRNQVKLTLCGQFAFLARRRQVLVPREETDSGERTGR